MAWNLVFIPSLSIDWHRKLQTWEVIQFNLHLKYQKVLFISFQLLLTWGLVLIFMYPWMWKNSIVISLFEKILCSDVSITVSVITTFFEVFRLFKFVNKIRCTENYLELHETNDIYPNPINQGLIWNLFWYICHREKFCMTIDMHSNLARSKFWDSFTKYFWTLHNFVKIIILETCLMIIYRRIA